MPEGIAATMSPQERRDLVRFLMDLGKPGNAATRRWPRSTRTRRRRSRSIARRSIPTAGRTGRRP